MAKKETNQKFRWQPELATSIIYWSLTFGIFFLSLIAFLEALGLSLLSVIFLGLFCVFAYLGHCRYFMIKNDQLMIYGILKRNRHQIDLSQITKISLGAYGMTFILDGHSEIEEADRSFLMSKKTISKFLEVLEQSNKFNGNVVSIKKSVG